MTDMEPNVQEGRRVMREGDPDEIVVQPRFTKEQALEIARNTVPLTDEERERIDRAMFWSDHGA